LNGLVIHMRGPKGEVSKSCSGESSGNGNDSSK
jgi:hypothetical protein